jgi:hypothetical protein
MNLQTLPSIFCFRVQATEKVLISQESTSNKAESTPTRMPPAVPLAGRKFQEFFLFRLMESKKEGLKVSFLVS